MSVIVECKGKKYKVEAYTVKKDDTIRLKSQFKPLWRMLYDTSDKIQPVVSDPITLPPFNRTFLTGNSLDSGFVPFTYVNPDVDGPIQIHGTELVLEYPGLIYHVQWEVVSFDDSIESSYSGDRETVISFLTPVYAPSFCTDRLYPMVDMSDNLTVYTGNKGEFRVTDYRQMYVHVNRLCTVNLNINVEIPKACKDGSCKKGSNKQFEDSKHKNSKLEDTCYITVDGCNIPVYTQKLSPEGVITKSICKNFKKISVKIHNTLEEKSLPIPLVRHDGPKVHDSLVFQRFIYAGLRYWLKTNNIADRLYETKVTIYGSSPKEEESIFFGIELTSLASSDKKRYNFEISYTIYLSETPDAARVVLVKDVSPKSWHYHIVDGEKTIHEYKNIRDKVLENKFVLPGSAEAFGLFVECGDYSKPLGDLSTITVNLIPV